MPNEIFGTDLKLTDKYWRKGELETDLQTVISRKNLKDFGLAAGYENLAQALTLRLLTPKGELSKLGHPDYGSRLHELIGEINNARTRGIAKLYCKEAILHDPRVEKIISIKANPVSRNRIDVHVEILPIKETKPLNLVFPFNLG